MNQLYSRLSDLNTLTVLLILLGACPQLYAQGTTTVATKNSITGLLTDERSQPIAFGLVNLVSVADHLSIKELLINEKGLYTIIGVPAGTYVIRALAFGSFDETTSVRKKLSLSYRNIKIQK